MTRDLAAHYCRRLIHLSLLPIPWLFYQYGWAIAQFFYLTPTVLLIAILVVVVLLEYLRLYFGIVVFGQRQHESRQPSSFAWGALGMVLVLVCTPKSIGIPIISSWVIGDPISGELRRLRCKKILVIIITLLVILSVWLVCHFSLGTPWWLAFIMAPITVAAEYLPPKWLDDNFTMQAIPLLLYGFIVTLKAVV